LSALADALATPLGLASTGVVALATAAHRVATVSAADASSGAREGSRCVASGFACAQEPHTKNSASSRARRESAGSRQRRVTSGR
jgi:hypothetical protein